MEAQGQARLSRPLPLKNIMQETVRALLGLQQIDRHIFKVEGELKRLPGELARRQTEIDTLARALEERRQGIEVLRKQVKEVDDLTTGQRQRLRKLETEASRNKLDAALYASYEHEMRTLKRTISQAEEDGLRMIDESERVEVETQELAARLEQEHGTFEEYKQSWTEEMSAAEAKLAELQTELETKQSQEISAGHLALYRGLLSTRHGEAMAQVHGQICQGCFVAIPKNVELRMMRGQDLVQCPSCDRILYGFPGRGALS